MLSFPKIASYPRASFDSEFFGSALAKIYVVVATTPFFRGESIAEECGAPKAGKLSTAKSVIVNRQKVAQEHAAQKIRSRTVQNEMKNILNKVT